MKILLIDLDGNQGGAEKILTQVYYVYRSEGIKCDFLTVRDSYFSKEIKDINTIRIDKNIVNLKYDLIIYNNKKSLKVLLFFKILFYKSRHVYYSHSYLSFIQSIMYRLLEPLLYNSVFVSKSLYDSYPGRNKSLVYNSVKPIYSDKRNRNVNGAINVFMWAQLREWKGHIMLIESFKMLWDYGLDIKLNLVYTTAGFESNKLLEHIRNEAVSLGKERLVLHENIDNHLDFIYQKADLAISSSIKDDPFPTIILESFGMKIPIIATRVGGCIEMLNNDERLLVDINQEDLANKIMEFSLLTRSEIDRIISSNYSRLINEFSYQNFRNGILNNL